MRQASKLSSQHKEKEGHVSKRLKEGSFILFAALSLFLFLALISYSQNDPGWSYQTEILSTHNLGGRAGAWFSDVLYVLFGYVAYLFPVGVAYSGYLIYQQGQQHTQHPVGLGVLKGAGFFMALFSISGLMSLHLRALTPLPMDSGGVIGNFLQSWLVTYCNGLGATVLLLALTLIGMTWFTGVSWVRVMDKIGQYSLWACDHCFVGLKATWTQLEAALAHGIKQAWLNFKAQRAQPQSQQAPLREPASRSQPQPNAPAAKLANTFGDTLDPVLPTASQKTKIQSEEPMILTPVVKKVFPKAELIVTPPVLKAEPKIAGMPVFKAEGNVTAPSLNLLENADAVGVIGYSKQQLEELSRLVEQRLSEFGVEVQVVAVSPGPVITRFEMELAAGVKVSRISNLAKDLARSLSVVSVRVVEVIPGKSVVGLEIPNAHREIVRLKDIFEDEAYQKQASPVTLGLGKDIAGHVVVADLTKMPHLLVAGTTGSGKSVGLNAMLLSILYKATPEEVRLILIDPKMLELSVYDNIPHLLTPVVTDMKDASNALRWCVAEMERRYQLMAALGVRNLKGYNQKVVAAEKQGTPLVDPLWIPAANANEPPPYLSQLPYIVVLIDEFADMMMVVGKKVEELIARIAQKARAAGIHLILATQRPSVDVITGLIKANIPTRIAFQVSSKIDSRTILDQSGAEQLLGHGDMLYLPPGVGLPTRVHGAFVSDEEVHKVVAEVRKQGKPEYIESITQSVQPGSFSTFSDEGGGEELDALYDQAIAIVVESRRPTISHIQRRLKIGYNRAARLIEQMETDGIVSGMQPNGTREVLAPPPQEE